MNLTTFDFRESAVRVLVKDAQPWFVATDVCRVLEIANSRDAIASLDEDEKITVANADGNPRAGIPHQMNLISESGLYALVFKSRKPEAKAFRKWVTAEVLPALRETGGYQMDGLKPELRTPARTVRDELASLRGLLLRSAEAVNGKGLDVGRAQQVANLAGRFLETIKLEGDATGYEVLFTLPAGTAGDGVLPPSGGPPAGELQTLPQRAVRGPAAGTPGLPSEAVCSEESVERTQPGADDAACAAMHGPPAVGPGTGGAACAETDAGMPGGAVGAAGGDPTTTNEERSTENAVSS